MKRMIAALLALGALSGCATIPTAPAVSKAGVWLTTADEAQKLSAHPGLAPIGPAIGSEAVTLDPSTRFQQMQGFGAAMSDASAELFQKLPPDRRGALLAELFGRSNGGLGFSFTRITVGASDFSSSHYSYNDTPGNAPDPQLRYFSIKPARTTVLPLVREARRLNPSLNVMISPWSAPAWMKTSKSLIKGQLEPRYYDAFARYLARTVEEFGREGVPVSHISIQNEPDFEPENYPGMRINPPERAQIIGRHVGPLFRERGIRTEILEWDHNWDKPEMPLAVLADPVARSFISGVAWHCYGGDVSAQSKVRDAYPDKDVWFTECSGGEWAPKFSETLGWMTENLIIGTANHWARGVLLWNLALDPTFGPHKGGCGNCRGVVTIDPATGDVTRNVEYYVLGHASRFVLPGAHRIGSTVRGAQTRAAAFLNPDGSRVAILHRKTEEGPITIALDGQHYALTLPAGSVATVRWDAPESRGR